MKRSFTFIFCLFTLPFTTFAAAPPALPNTPKIFKPAEAIDGAGITAKGDTVILPPVNQPAPLSGDYNIYRRRLDSIKKDVPLDYNEYVQAYIDIYAHSREEMAGVLGRTKYYFPIYEKAFKDAGIPDELKYLSIVESKLDPYAVSRVGATGPWQFMYTTARLYGLSIDDYVDDRRDPIQATYAAAAYLKDAYEEFGDWLLAIASYNCGKSNVEHAIDKAGASDFWSIRPYLPAETRGYVPAFIAVTYLMNYYSKHNIIPHECDMALKTDTVVVNKFISLSDIAQALNVNVAQLAVLNPAYKKMIVNGTNQAPRRLVIPQVDKNRYSALYDVLNSGNPNPLQMPAHAVIYRDKPAHRPDYHTVRRGETLRDIADAYGVEVQDIKAWNHLHNNKAETGKKLRLNEGGDDSGSDAAPGHSSNYLTYKVKRGDTLSGIASRFEGASVEKIRSLNGLKKDMLQPGMTIRISRG